MSHSPLDWIAEELAALAARDLRRDPPAHQGPAGATCCIAGRDCLNFGSNDYLNLAADKRLAEAARSAIEQSGWGSAASPLLAGRGDEHLRLEADLAAFEHTEAALVFSSGFAANLGAVAALVAQDDALFSDAMNHASLIDGCRLSRATIHVYPHADLDHLERLLANARTARRRLIVTDALFSMDGDLAPLAQLAELAQRHVAMLLVDEAHATGVFGPSGSGVCEHCGIHEDAVVRVGTLSKALGGIGGFVCGRRDLIEWLLNRARPYVFSTAPPAAACAAASAALAIVRDEPDRRRQLLDRAARLRQSLSANGWDIGRSQSQIIPLIVGDARAAADMAKALLEQGLYVPAIRPPSVAEGTSRLRISLTAGHDESMIARLEKTLQQIRE